MSSSPRETRDAFRLLEHRLAARRFAALNTRMRVLVVLLGGYVTAFAYWQARVPLDGVRHMKGEHLAALTLGGVLAALALLGAAAAAWRRATFGGRVPGPEWLALPVPPAAVGRHLDADASQTALAALPPAIAVLAAGFGLVSPLHLLALAAAFVLLAAVLTRSAVALAARSVRPPARGARPLEPAVRDLAALRARAAERPRRAPRWRAEPAWRAIARLDGLASGRRSPSRTRLLLAGAWFVAGALAWFAGAPPLTARALAYAAFAAGAATLGAWAIARACADPPSITRTLPLRIADPWRARAVRVAVVLAAVSVLAALLAWPLPPMARVGLVLTFLPSGLAIALLGVNYGLTLAPRATIAENLYYGWLAVALVASWMIPFLGWGVLIAGLIHSGRRVARSPLMEID